MLSTTNANINHTQRDTLVCDSSIERGMNIHDNFEIIMCNTQLQQTIDERRVELLWFKVMLSRCLRYAPMLSLVTYPQWNWNDTPAVQQPELQFTEPLLKTNSNWKSWKSVYIQVEPVRMFAVSLPHCCCRRAACARHKLHTSVAHKMLFYRTLNQVDSRYRNVCWSRAEKLNSAFFPLLRASFSDENEAGKIRL